MDTFDTVRENEASESKRVCPREQVIHGPRQLMGQHGEGVALAVFAFQFDEVLFARLILA